MASDIPAFNEPQLQAMRGFLQRAEVRLSTMHRIGGAFLSGAGLLLLLPVFAKDALSALADAFVRMWPLVSEQAPLNVWIFLYLVPPVVVFAIPLYAIWALLRELSIFYFSASIPANGYTSKFADELPFHPRFALTAIPLCDDENPILKQYLRKVQFTTSLKRFLLSPNKRRIANLKAQMGTEDGKRVALPADSDLLQSVTGAGSSDLPPHFDEMRLAFGLAGAYNRGLADEVAKSELSLIRHNLVLRRLVLRYMKALLSIIWTAMIFFVLLACLSAINKAPSTEVSGLVCFWGQFKGLRCQDAIIQFAVIVSFLVWSTITPVVIRAPVRWIYHEYDQNMEDMTRDRDLVRFEQVVTGLCALTALICVIDLYPVLKEVSFYLVLAPLLACLVFARALGFLGQGIFRWV